MRRFASRGLLVESALVAGLFISVPASVSGAGMEAGSPVAEGGGQAAVTPAAAGEVREPAGFRMDDYRAPLPSTLQGARVIDTATAMRLHEEGVAFVDVLPRAPRPKGLPADTVWRPKPRSNIPGSVWLVDTGYGELAPVMEKYLMDGLAEVTGDDKAKPIVMYCQRDCWMSYNAAKRAVQAGYSNILWYPEGTDGWTEAGGRLEPAEPKDRPDE